jgi:hypothetical protein
LLSNGNDFSCLPSSPEDAAQQGNYQENLDIHTYLVNLVNNFPEATNKYFNPATFCHPYLSVKLQNMVAAKVLYDAGSDISFMSESVFLAIRTYLQPLSHQTN